MTETLVEINNVSKFFHAGGGLFNRKNSGIVKAVNNVTFKIFQGETLGLIGESGCGKSTISRLIMGLIPPTCGQVMFEGEIVDRRINTKIRGAMQMVFQDPYSSVDPRMNVRRIIEEPLRIHSRMTKKERRDRSLPLMESLGFKEEDLEKFPHEFSGGQLQRIGIARAFITNPRFVICDEPVSALDMSIQSQILNLFKELQKERGVTYLFISHDMNVIKHVSNRIAIMYLGHVVELADKKEFFGNTLHPYSRALISAIPVPNPGHKRNRIHLSGELPNPLNPPRGCPFGTRCPKAIDLCRESLPSLKAEAPGHWAACHLLPEASGTNQGEHT